MCKHALLKLFILAGILSANPALAAGPVSAGSLPGGATVTDDDGGSGESWGRAVGRTFTYSDFDTARFTSLSWQAISAGMAFDGTIDAAAETMSVVEFDVLDVVFEGQTTVALARLSGQGCPSTSCTISTRFSVTLAGAVFLLTAMTMIRKMQSSCQRLSY